MAFEYFKREFAHLKEINRLRKLALKQTKVLKEDIRANQRDIDDIKRAVAHYNFKNAAPLARIDEKLAKYKNE